MKGTNYVCGIGLAGCLMLLACSGPQQRGPQRIPPAPPEQDVAETRGNALTPEQIEDIQRTVKVGGDALKHCYAKELERRGDKELVGRVMFNIRIGTARRALGVTIGAESTLKVPQVQACMKAAVLKWDFPRLKSPFLYTTTLMFDPAY